MLNRNIFFSVNLEGRFRIITKYIRGRTKTVMCKKVMFKIGKVLNSLLMSLLILNPWKKISVFSFKQIVKEIKPNITRNK